jgi:hypothetical protein
MTPRGMEMREENAVTAIEAMIKGKIPKSGGSEVGYQYLPNRKFFRETFSKMGIPSMKRKNTMSPSVVMEARAMLKNKNLMLFSFV